MGYIGQMPGRPEELPGRETATAAPPEPGGASASELPVLLAPGTRSVSLAIPAPKVPEPIATVGVSDPAVSDPAVSDPSGADDADGE